MQERRSHLRACVRVKQSQKCSKSIKSRVRVPIIRSLGTIMLRSLEVDVLESREMGSV